MHDFREIISEFRVLMCVGMHILDSNLVVTLGTQCDGVCILPSFTSWITSCSASRFKRAAQIVQMIVKDNLPQTRHFDFEDAS